MEAATLSYANYNPRVTTVTDALGTSRSYTVATTLNVYKNTNTTQPGGSGCAGKSSTQTYDANGNVASRTDFNGNVTTYVYDLSRNLETKRVEASGKPESRTISTAWHSYWRLPVQVAEPKKLTTWIYNGDTVGGQTVNCAPADATVPSINGSTQPIGVLCRKTEQATTDANGSQGFSAPVTGSARTWAWSYDRYGQVLTADGPRTDVNDLTTYTYYDIADPDLGKRGNLATVTDALGHLTRITAYDLNGRPLTIVDPNGLTTQLTYDPRGRLTSKNVGGETTVYSYDPVGQLTRVTLPDGAYITYTYDPAHRLTDVSDNLGNRIHYTLDPMGNRTQEQVFDPNNQLARTRSRVYDALSRLYQDISAQNKITQYAYDANGNLTSVTDPLNHVTANAYDALDRLIKITDPGLGQTKFAYDGQDRTVQVTDPRNLVTAYTVDGLGNQTQQVSPDTGTQVRVYDEAGNLLSSTDAKGQTTTYQYDALNRRTLATAADGSQIRSTWDQGANGIGRLALLEELAGGQVVAATGYAYDAWGRIVGQTDTQGGVTTGVGYAYGNGDLAAVTYPSGRRVDYSRDAMGRINQVQLTDNGQVTVVARDIQYRPFGGVQSYVTGSGQTVTRSYDQDGRIAGYTLGGQSWQIGYDDAGRIGYQTDAGNAANTVSYGYDALDRLTGAALPNTNLGYGYDANGNRTSQTVGAASYTYQVGTTSNRLQSITTTPPRSFGFDANGSVTQDGANTYTYDARGRMNQATTAAGTTQYRVNAQGQRVRKTNAQEDTRYRYDLQGHLIAETDPGGRSVREYLYLDDLPLVVLQ